MNNGTQRVRRTLFGLDLFVDRRDERLVHITATGELDLATSAKIESEFERVISDDQTRTVVLDLSGISFMDSTGLRALWTVRQHMQAAGGTLMLNAPSESVLRVLRMTKLNKVFQIVGADASDG